MKKNNQSKLYGILLANTEDLLIMSVMVSLKNQGSLLYFSTTYLDTTRLFIKNIGKTQGNIKCIPNNDEKYISSSMNIEVDKYTVKDKKEDIKKRQLCMNYDFLIPVDLCPQARVV